MSHHIIIGIDIGGSTTKIVGFNTSHGNSPLETKLIDPLFVRATDPKAFVTVYSVSEMRYQPKK